MVKKEVFEWIITKQKSIELRKGKAKKGDVAVFQCGRNILKRKIIKKEEGNLTDVLRKDKYKNIVVSSYPFFFISHKPLNILAVTES